MNNTLLRKNIEGKSILWFSQTNNYLILHEKTADIIVDFNLGIDINTIAEKLQNTLDVGFESASSFVNETYTNIFLKNTTAEPEISSLRIQSHDFSDIIFEVIKYYRINDVTFKVCFETSQEAFYVHPKFEHLELKTNDNPTHIFLVYKKNNLLSLVVDNHLIGSWTKQDLHYFQGKFSMELVQKMHAKTEKDWMSVFHASAVSDSRKAILFLGDSGNGKSTSLAILQANGYTCLADDFVPVCASTTHVYSFPAAISVKKKSIDVLAPMYPSLLTTKEYNFKALGKVVYFLPPNITSFNQQLPCKALVFIKYAPDSDLSVTPISKLEAFEHLVPDSWLSPKTDNAQSFLNWFEQLDCYRLTYSNNKKMVAAVSKIFKDDL